MFAYQKVDGIFVIDPSAEGHWVGVDKGRKAMLVDWQVVCDPDTGEMTLFTSRGLQNRLIMLGDVRFVKGASLGRTVAPNLGKCNSYRVVPQEPLSSEFVGIHSDQPPKNFMAWYAVYGRSPSVVTKQVLGNFKNGVVGATYWGGKGRG